MRTTTGSNDMANPALDAQGEATVEVSTQIGDKAQTIVEPNTSSTTKASDPTLDVPGNAAGDAEGTNKGAAEPKPVQGVETVGETMVKNTSETSSRTAYLLLLG